MNSLRLLLSCLLDWRHRPASPKQLAHCQAILGQSFGGRSLTDPGLTNYALAGVAARLAAGSSAPLLLQWEIALALAEQRPMMTVNHTVREHWAGEYLDTFEVLRQIAVVCRANGGKRVAIVAHPAHAWRVARVAARLGLDPVIVNTVGVPYDPESIQPWTRSAWRFLPRELAARLMYFLKEYI